MTTESELDRLRDAALADPGQEPAFLRALLSATLYAHRPISDDSGKFHLLMFTRPDGLTVVPVFTDLGKAQAAAGIGARIVAAPGRTLLEATRGATLMLDPNDATMTLYPEELMALLDEGRANLAPVAFDGPGLDLLELPDRDAWLLDLIEKALRTVPGAQRVHLATARPAGTSDPADRLLAIIAVPGDAVERAARAIAVALDAAPRVPWLPLDLASYAPGDPLPPELRSGLAHACTRDVLHGG